MRPLGPVRRYIVHHTASPRATTVGDLHRWHVTERGWADIGYHFLIDGAGEVMSCRSLEFEGAHARGHNSGSIGVAVAGDNTKIEHRWSPRQTLALYRHWRAARSIFPGIELFGHRNLAQSTECPGLDVRALLLGP